MKRQFSWMIALLAVLVFSESKLGAQPPVPGGGVRRPAFSPYLNIVRPGGSVAQNYYGLVRPEVQARQAIQGLQGSVAANQQALSDIQSGNTELSATGHQASFLTHRGYFLTGGAIGGASGGPTFGGATFGGAGNRAAPRR